MTTAQADSQPQESSPPSPARALAAPATQAVGAGLLYFAAACWFTWPMVTDPSHIFYGAAGDPYGTMAFFRELVEGHHNPFLPGTIADFNAPGGQPIPWARNIASMPAIAVLYALTALLGPVAAVGTFTLMAFTLSGLAMFLLARRVCGNGWAALIAGWAFAFYPFAIINAQGHYDYVHGWVLVVGVWRMLELIDRPTRRNAVLAGLGVAFGMWWTPYFILFGGVAYFALALAGLVVAWRRGKLRAAVPAQALAALLVVGFLAVLAGLSTQASGESVGLRQHGVEELNTYSARVPEYVVPAAQTPLFGDRTGPWLAKRLHGSNASESTLYVGVSTILLALLAVALALLGRLDARTRGWVAAVAFMTVVVVVSSAPPEGTILGVNVPFPAHFVSMVTSTWRAYSRFVIVVMLGVALLASVGIAWLIGGRSRVVRLGLFALVAAVVVVDLWGRLDGRTNRVADLQIYRDLKREPYGIVAEYPLVPAGYSTYNELFFQDAHGKPILNGYLEGTREEARAASLSKLSDSSTAPRLAALGVRYVLLRTEPPSYGQPGAGRPTSQFRRLAGDPYATLYAVVPRRSQVAVTLTDGFSPPEIGAGGSFQWLVAHSGTIELAGRCGTCAGTLRIRVGSFRRPRIVELLDHGRVVLRHRVAGPERFAVPLTFSRLTDLELRATPGPEPVGASDPRQLAIQVLEARFERDRARSASRSR